MFKPLLRTIPSLNGNMKISCYLQDYKETTHDIFTTAIKYADLQPLSSNLFCKNVNVKLIQSRFDYDVKKYYDIYKANFYKSNYKFNKKDMDQISFYEDNSMILNLV